MILKKTNLISVNALKSSSLVSSEDDDDVNDENNNNTYFSDDEKSKSFMNATKAVRQLRFLLKHPRVKEKLIIVKGGKNTAADALPRCC